MTTDLVDEQRRVVTGADPERIASVIWRTRGKGRAKDHLSRLVVADAELKARDEEHLLGSGELARTACSTPGTPGQP